MTIHRGMHQRYEYNEWEEENIWQMRNTVKTIYLEFREHNSELRKNVYKYIT